MPSEGGQEAARPPSIVPGFNPAETPFPNHTAVTCFGFQITRVAPDPHFCLPLRELGKIKDKPAAQQEHVQARGRSVTTVSEYFTSKAKRILFF